MFKLKNSFRVTGLTVLVLALTLFLTGCFDIYQEIWVGIDPENSSMRATFTTTSEEIYEMMKASLTSDPELEEGEVSFELLEPESPEEETKYKIIITTAPEEENTIFAFPYNGGTAYEISLLSEEDRSGIDETTRSLFEGHTYRVDINFPRPITEAWWGRANAEVKDFVEEGLISEKKFSLKTDLLTAFTEDFAYLTVVTEG